MVYQTPGLQRGLLVRRGPQLDAEEVRWTNFSTKQHVVRGVLEGCKSDALMMGFEV